MTNGVMISIRFSHTTAVIEFTDVMVSPSDLYLPSAPLVRSAASPAATMILPWSLVARSRSLNGQCRTGRRGPAGQGAVTQGAAGRSRPMNSISAGPDPSRSRTMRTM